MSGESRGDCGHYLFTAIEEMHVEEWIMPLGQGTPRPLKIGFLHDAMSEGKQSNYGCWRTISHVSESTGRK